MGDYARHNGQRIKLGSTGSFYWLRFDQAHLITAADDQDFDVTRYVDHIRFRFPFPDEDQVQPGDHVGFAGLERGVTVPVPAPASVCRRDHEPAGSEIVQQRVWENRLVTVCRCTGCGAFYRLPEFADVEPVVVALRSSADRAQFQSVRCFLNTVADRITEGYRMDVAAVLRARLDPEPEAGAPVELTEEEAKALERAGRNEVTKRLRQILKARTGRAWAVRGSTGTGWGYIHVDVPAARKGGHRASEEDVELLSKVLGWRVGGSPLWMVTPDPGGYAAALQAAAGQPVTVTVHR